MMIKIFTVTLMLSFGMYIYAEKALSVATEDNHKPNKSGNEYFQDRNLSCSDYPSGWYDSFGPKYDCNWYAIEDRCEVYGTTSRNAGKIAEEACCSCGGGHYSPIDDQNNDGYEVLDFNDYTKYPSASPSDESGQLSSNSNHCGVTWEDAVRKCGPNPCPQGRDDECPQGQRCFAAIPCKHDHDTFTNNYCANSWEDVAECSSTMEKCPNQWDAECPLGQKCFVTSCNNDKNPSSEPSQQPSLKPSLLSDNSVSKNPSSAPTIKTSNTSFCGLNWADAARNCGQSCPNGKDVECPSGQKCYADVTSCNSDRNPTKRPSKVPSSMPSTEPSKAPSSVPSMKPSCDSDNNPIKSPTQTPSSMPSMEPSSSAFNSSTKQPSKASEQANLRQEDRVVKKGSTFPAYGIVLVCLACISFLVYFFLSLRMRKKSLQKQDGDKSIGFTADDESGQLSNNSSDSSLSCQQKPVTHKSSWLYNEDP